MITVKEAFEADNIVRNSEEDLNRRMKKVTGLTSSINYMRGYLTCLFELELLRENLYLKYMEVLREKEKYNA